MKKKTGVNVKEIERYFRENPPDFPPDEVERRMAEVMRRCFNQPGTFDLETGQTYKEPHLSDDELKRRGYDVVPACVPAKDDAEGDSG